MKRTAVLTLAALLPLVAHAQQQPALPETTVSETEEVSITAETSPTAPHQDANLLAGITTLPVTRSAFIADALALAQKADTNHNGTLEPAEQAAAAQNLLPGAELEKELPGCASLTSLGEQWVTSGTLAPDSKPIALADISAQAGTVFDFLDTDRDGTLTQTEFDQTMAQLKTTCAESGPAIRKLFSKDGQFKPQNLKNLNDTEVQQLMHNLAPFLQRSEQLNGQ